MGVEFHRRQLPSILAQVISCSRRPLLSRGRQSVDGEVFLVCIATIMLVDGGHAPSSLVSQGLRRECQSRGCLSTLGLKYVVSIPVARGRFAIPTALVHQVIWEVMWRVHSPAETRKCLRSPRSRSFHQFAQQVSWGWMTGILRDCFRTVGHAFGSKILVGIIPRSIKVGVGRDSAWSGTRE